MNCGCKNLSLVLDIKYNEDTNALDIYYTNKPTQHYFVVLSAIDLSGKVDKVAGKSLIADTEIARLLTLSNADLSNYYTKEETRRLALIL